MVAIEKDTNKFNCYTCRYSIITKDNIFCTRFFYIFKQEDVYKVNTKSNHLNYFFPISESVATSFCPIWYPHTVSINFIKFTILKWFYKHIKSNIFNLMVIPLISDILLSYISKYLSLNSIYDFIIYLDIKYNIKIPNDGIIYYDEHNIVKLDDILKFFYNSGVITSDNKYNIDFYKDYHINSSNFSFYRKFFLKMSGLSY